MKKNLKILALALILVTVYIIYIVFSPNKEKINYVALGDSLAEGMNSYNALDYGYADYVKDDLKSNNKLGTYTKAFSKSGYATNDLVEDINNNKNTFDTVANKTFNIKEKLRESDLVTISIGANDFLKGLSIANLSERVSNIDQSKTEIDAIVEKVEDLIVLIKQYAKGQIILVGYYNPLPAFTNAKSQIDEIVIYANNKYRHLAKRLEIDYIDIFSIFNNERAFLPNPTNIHPNIKGYEAISKEIIKKIAN